MIIIISCPKADSQGFTTGNNDKLGTHTKALLKVLISTSMIN